MFNKTKPWLVGMMAGLIILLLAAMARPAFARSISLKEAGVALWIFIIIGAVIVLLQLIPAAILFFSFIGTSSSMVFKRKKEAGIRVAEEKAVLAGVEPEPVKK
jgi:hypothetical protein